MLLARALALCIVLGCACGALAQEIKVDLGKFTQELQYNEQSGDNMRLIWWIPTEFWVESFRDANMTQAQKDEFILAVDDYIVVAVIDGELNPLGGSKWRSVEEIKKNLTVKVGEGEPESPLATSEIAEGTNTMMAVMKPMFRKMLGDFGNGLEMICFRGKDDDKQRLLDPRETGHFSVNYKGKDYNWRLPLGTLLAPKFDAETGERFPGNFIFSPFTGERLVDVAP